MKIKILNILIIALTFLAISANAQDSPKSDSEVEWTRIETADKDFSVAFPANFIVDAEKRERGQKLKVYGFKNDVTMEFRLIKDSQTKQFFQMMSPAPTKNFSGFKKNGFEIKRVFSIDSSKTFEEDIYILDDSNYYILTLKSDQKDREEVQRFLFSIKLKNDYLFVTPKDLNYSEKTVSIKELVTNPEVIEAFERKSDKKKGAVTKEISGEINEFKSYKDFSRPLVILDKPFPGYRPEIPTSSGAVKSFDLKLEVEFLANGQIGNIKIFNDENKSYTDACIEAARKIKFIPAQINGVNVDSTKIIDYSMKMISVVSAPILISPGQRNF